MELKYLVILSVFGAVAGYTVPQSDLESSFPLSSSDSETPTTREKRGLLFKKLKKHQNTVYVDRRSSEGTVGYGYRPNREVHHHHHYSSYPNGPVQQPPQYQPYPAPSQDYHHYHGAAAGGYQQQGSYANAGSYYSGGGYSSGGSNYYAPRPNYGDGGYAHYGANGGYNGQQIAAAPVASGHNSVDRGQGAAAVNNIAIIHARAGSSNNLVESESKILPRPLPVDIEDVLNSMER